MSTHTRHSYKTITAPSEGEYTEKRSKFLSFAFPVSSEEDARTILDEMRRKYYDARHVCWAYIIGKKERMERCNDDGEPSSTAGKPILGQILSHDLTDCLVIVVRYFGGVKLGTGGLIVAYKAAAASALESAEIIEHELTTRYTLTFGFDFINPVMILLRNTGAETVESGSDIDGYIWTVDVKDKDTEVFESQASTLYQLKVSRTE